MVADDPLNNEISVSGEMTETGLRGAAKSRAIAALDRLLGNIIDYPSSFLESGAAKRRAKTEGSVRVIKALADAAVKEIEEEYRDFARAAIEGHYHEIILKQENKEAVAQIAVEDLAQAADAEPKDGESGDKALGEDWLNYFTSYAEKASSVKLREAFGRILSGEIRRPGSFSFSTLRIVSELDAVSASLFQELASKALSMSPDSVNPASILEPAPLTGKPLEGILKLEALGLVQGVGGNYSMTMKRDPSRVVYLRFGPFMLVGKFGHNKGEAARLNLIKLTPSGVELCSVIPMAYEAAAKEVGKRLSREGLVITLHKIERIVGKAVSLSQPGEPIGADYQAPHVR